MEAPPFAFPTSQRENDTSPSGVGGRPNRHWDLPCVRSRISRSGIRPDGLDLAFPAERVVLSDFLRRLCRADLLIPQDVTHTIEPTIQVAAKGAERHVELFGRFFLRRGRLQVRPLHSPIVFFVAGVVR